MELSNVLDQRTKELRAWREETILTIRKSFQFDDVDGKIELPCGIEISPCTHQDSGFGISGIIKGDLPEYVYIVARPDCENQEIIVTTRSGHEKIETFSIAAYIVGVDDPTPEEHLREIIVDFLAKLCITREKLSW